MQEQVLSVLVILDLQNQMMLISDFWIQIPVKSTKYLTKFLALPLNRPFTGTSRLYYAVWVGFWELESPSLWPEEKKGIQPEGLKFFYHYTFNRGTKTQEKALMPIILRDLPSSCNFKNIGPLLKCTDDYYGMCLSWSWWKYLQMQEWP